MALRLFRSSVTPYRHTLPKLMHPSSENGIFDEHKVLHDLKHFLPAQAPLKDFIHHNTLHAFQGETFHTALHKAARIFGYKTYFTVNEYRKLYAEGRIRPEILQAKIAERYGPASWATWQHKLLDQPYDSTIIPRIGALRSHWKRDRRVDLDALVHTMLFRTLNSFLDQGVAIWNFPVWNKGFLECLRELEKHAWTGFFRSERARGLLMDESTSITELLTILVGDGSLFADYLFDQQFGHSGWSGLVSTIEDMPSCLLDRRNIALRDVIIFELLLEIDALDDHFPKGWEPLASGMKHRPRPLFHDVPRSDLEDVRSLWHEAYEWSYYDGILAALVEQPPMNSATPVTPKLQALFCLDDRECSLRRYLEREDPGIFTFGTPGHFGVEFYYRPDQGKFNTKVCPAPITPRYVIKEVDKKEKLGRDVHFTKHSHGLASGWLISQTLGFWSALKLFINIFKPSMSPGTSDSFKHMDALASLTVESTDPAIEEDGLQVGFTVPEMAARLKALLKSIGLVNDFAPLIYVIGHGASSVNNPHYAAYDCGACSGRPGSVNARVICFMANHPGVRALLTKEGIVIPDATRFVGGLHDTTRDEIAFYDGGKLEGPHRDLHTWAVERFRNALDVNAKERSRRFESVDTMEPAARVHERVKRRSVSLFEPRPELNHATNALCIVGRRELTKGVFLDRRSFLNSFDAQVDPDGSYLLGILNAAAPVCGGINLEYFFSRMDNQKLGAGSKLPHNVMGLVGVANGIEGDLRPGLPSQMIEVHDPVRLLLIVEHDPAVVLRTIKKVAATYQWFENEWVHLVVVDPKDRSLHRFAEGGFRPYTTLRKTVPTVSDILSILEKETENVDVHLLESA